MTQSKRLRITATCRAVFPAVLVLSTSQPRFSSMRAIWGHRPGGHSGGSLPGHSSSISKGREVQRQAPLLQVTLDLHPHTPVPQELGDKWVKTNRLIPEASGATKGSLGQVPQHRLYEVLHGICPRGLCMVSRLTLNCGEDSAESKAPPALPAA